MVSENMAAIYKQNYDNNAMLHWNITKGEREQLKIGMSKQSIHLVCFPPWSTFL